MIDPSADPIWVPYFDHSDDFWDAAKRLMTLLAGSAEFGHWNSESEKLAREDAHVLWIELATAKHRIPVAEEYYRKAYEALIEKLSFIGTFDEWKNFYDDYSGVLRRFHPNASIGL